MTVHDLTASGWRPGAFGLVLSIALSLTPIATATEAVTVPAGVEGDFLVVVWNRDVRYAFAIDRTRLQSKLLSQKGLLPDGTRPWSVSSIMLGKQGRLQHIPFANAAEYHALAGVFWRYHSPDGQYALVGHGYENDTAAIESVDLVRVSTGHVVASIRFGRKRFIKDMLWLPDSRSVVLLDVDDYVGSIMDALTYFAPHGTWTGDVYVHIVDAGSGKVDRIEVARRLKNPSAALAIPSDVVH